MSLKDDYRARYQSVLASLAVELQAFIEDILKGEPRIDRVSARPKEIARFLKKAENIDLDGNPKYAHPMHQIQDQVGARIIVFYKSDVQRISEILLKYLRPTETKDLVPNSEWQFGYFGRHFVCLFPREIINPDWPVEQIPEFFELQIKTLFQHAWSEANHDLGYKPEGGELTGDQLRMLAYTSAQAWGADRAFDELHSNIQTLQ
ncbi:RelA/SpoT domain-containing protein [Sphingomonas sp. AR_OL41]|uniref:GTP pyrophosphokinase n=1 Tax=Sphingomonas sp. AR_OL41 TaxID=3042729 RepID=UPI002480BD6A|nr:RelA/SpoT domain-containing protein [Sphingomonas sp. AR_OL41]MDH7973525.1 RelA/SpoT domain-containing protein [Sphingomonas sp. AR_OL41]